MKALKDVLDEFPRLATITEELTNEAKWKDDSATQIQIQKGLVAWATWSSDKSPLRHFGRF